MPTLPVVSLDAPTWFSWAAGRCLSPTMKLGLLTRPAACCGLPGPWGSFCLCSGRCVPATASSGLRSSARSQERCAIQVVALPTVPSLFVSYFIIYRFIQGLASWYRAISL